MFKWIVALIAVLIVAVVTVAMVPAPTESCVAIGDITVESIFDIQHGFWIDKFIIPWTHTPHQTLSDTGPIKMVVEKFIWQDGWGGPAGTETFDPSAEGGSEPDNPQFIYKAVSPGCMGSIRVTLSCLSGCACEDIKTKNGPQH